MLKQSTPVVGIGLVLVLGTAFLSPGPDAQAVARMGCPAVPDDMVRLSGGETVIGDDEGYADEGPAYKTTVTPFWIDRHEVTNRQFSAFVAATGYVTTAERTDGPRGSIVFSPPDYPVALSDPARWWRFVEGANWRHPRGPGSDIRGLEALPVVHVTLEDAEAYAKWAGRRLPTEEQFEYAARAGVLDNPHAQPEPDRANTFQGHFPDKDSGRDGYRGPAPVGCYKPNAYGLSDVIGNVWEWTRSPYAPGHGAYVADAGTPPSRTAERMLVIKGGSFLCTPDYCARYRPAARHAQAWNGSASHLGFRTVKPGDL